MRSNTIRFQRFEKFFRCLVILFFLFGTGSPAIAGGSSTYFMPITFQGWKTGPGNITGKVSDAANPNPLTNGIGGVRVCYLTNCFTTNDSGNYTLLNVPSGFQVIEATKDAFEPQSSGVIVFGTQTVTLNIAMTQVLSKSDVEIRFIVTWRTEKTWPPDNVENDLDSELWMVIPPEIGIPEHIDPANYRGACAAYPYACVERDAREGAGPETVDIRKLQPNMMYYFGVLNYNVSYYGVPPITKSVAKIQVYNTSGLINTLNVPTTGSGELWYAFMIDSSGNITPTNCITSMPSDPINPGDPMVPPSCP